MDLEAMARLMQQHEKLFGNRSKPGGVIDNR